MVAFAIKLISIDQNMAVDNYEIINIKVISQQYQSILLAASMDNHHLHTFTQYYPNANPSSTNLHQNNQTHSWSNFYKNHAINTAILAPSSPHHSYTKIQFSARGIRSEKNLPAPIQAVIQGKHKRNTFPQLQMEMATPANRISPSLTNQTSLNRKINFTYLSPTNNFNPSLQRLASSSQYPQLNLAKANVFQFPRKERRKMKNRLSSSEFSFIYIPVQKIREDLPWMIQCQKVTSSLIKQDKTSITIPCYKMEDSRTNLVNESKMASTIATQSFYNQNRKSDFTSHQNYKYTDFSNNSYFDKNQKPNLIDQIPKAKLLGQTVILTHNDYSFGGIIEKNSPFNQTFKEKYQVKKGIVQQCELRQWNSHVQCLIDNRDSQDLKQSIHQGPEIRLQRHKFQMLDGFGREIKESSMSYQ